MLKRTILRWAGHVHRDSSGQMAFLFVLSLLVVFVFFALAFDAGLWYFDHRTAQNQSEAAALAAVQELPDTDTGAATAAADDWLTKNGSDATEERECLEYSDRNGDGSFETARVCVGRDSPGIFAGLSKIDFVHVSAAATATVGPVSIANVMPWGIVPPDPDCGNPSEACQDRDTNGDTIIDGSDDTCGYYPPVPPGEVLCPWGLNEDRLYPFKVSGTITPGNFGIIQACGNGATNYVDCITGENVSEFFEEGDTVHVDTQTGNMGANTNSALEDRYSLEGADGVYECDVPSTPDATTGLDPDGKDVARDKFVDEPEPGCDFRLVIVPVIHHFPPQGASEDILVLGVATYGIAKWDRNPPWGDGVGTADDQCGQAPGAGFDCGMVWGYLMHGAQPPDFLLEQIGDTDNPFAPLLIALIE